VSSLSVTPEARSRRRAEATFWERGNDGGVSLPTIGGRKALTRADFRIRRNYRRDQLTPEIRSVERKRCP